MPNIQYMPDIFKYFIYMKTLPTTVFWGEHYPVFTSEENKVLERELKILHLHQLAARIETESTGPGLSF